MPQKKQGKSGSAREAAPTPDDVELLNFERHLSALVTVCPLHSMPATMNANNCSIEHAPDAPWAYIDG